ncbi:hypothetical protein AB0I28_20690 [Phytomonospora sp. NPDC050363]|uniref:hypothetical protein n=1 Tax=Phytomonospora sp. NPDC050363 TaxID=3155642 RepID=UPI0033F34C94
MLALVCGLLLLAGCGVRPSEVIPAGDAPKQHATIQVMLYWLEEGRLVAQPRLVGEALDLDGAVAMLMAGPTPSELAFDLGTALPGGDFDVSVLSDGNGIEVRFETSVAGWSGLAVDQVVCTAVAAENRYGSVAAFDRYGSVLVAGDDFSFEARQCPLL